MPQYFDTTDPDQLSSFLLERDRQIALGKRVVVCFQGPETAIVKEDNLHTDQQRKAVHLWFSQVAKLFNDNGIEKHNLIEKLHNRDPVLSQWTGAGFKEDVYRPIYRAVTAKVSTTEASTTDADVCVTALTQWVSQEFDGLLLPPFPSIHT